MAFLTVLFSQCVFLLIFNIVHVLFSVFKVVPTSSDYLIPNHIIPTTPEQIESTSSVEKLLPDNSEKWETSFIMPHSRSTQPLLMTDNNKDDEGATSVSLNPTLFVVIFKRIFRLVLDDSW